MVISYEPLMPHDSKTDKWPAVRHENTISPVLICTNSCFVSTPGLRTLCSLKRSPSAHALGSTQLRLRSSSALGGPFCSSSGAMFCNFLCAASRNRSSHFPRSGGSPCSSRLPISSTVVGLVVLRYAVPIPTPLIIPRVSLALS